MEEKEVVDAIEAHKADAVKALVDAFNEGFMLGRKYAEKQFTDFGLGAK